MNCFEFGGFNKEYYKRFGSDSFDYLTPREVLGQLVLNVFNDARENRFSNDIILSKLSPFMHIQLYTKFVRLADALAEFDESLLSLKQFIIDFIRYPKEEEEV